MPKAQPSSKPLPSKTADPSFRWADELQTRLASSDLTKGQRAPIRLRAAFATVAEDVPYQALRVADISEAAGMSHGIFYHYYKDKRDIALSTIHEFAAHFEEIFFNTKFSDDRFESIYRANLYYLNTFAKNAGLMRTSLMMAEEDDDYRETYNQTIHRWHMRLAGPIDRAAGRPSREDDKERLLQAYALGGMMDQLCRQLFLHRSAFVADLVQDNEHLARSIALIWYRAAHGANPGIPAADRPAGANRRRR